ncbi:hypothetical protein KY360_01515 [Candidatus Woesearchaeota archaeon]|nr:hypothetical protein [Candidatus Woesearchaeota archaeon]
MVKLSGAVEHFVNGYAKAIERKVDLLVERVDNIFLRKALQVIFLAFSITSVMVGVILFFSRFFPLDVILIVSGGLCLYLTLLFKMMR